MKLLVLSLLVVAASAAVVPPLGLAELKAVPIDEGGEPDPGTPTTADPGTPTTDDPATTPSGTDTTPAGTDTTPTGTDTTPSGTDTTPSGTDTTPTGTDTTPTGTDTTTTEPPALSGGEIAGIVIGSIAGVGLLGFGIFMLKKKALLCFA